MMDLSDGLRQDLPKLCKASGVGAMIEPHCVPIHESLRGLPDSFSYAVGFGEEYELLFTAAPHHREAILDTATSFGANLTRVGVIRSDEEAEARLSEGHWPDPLFSHFSKATG